MAHTPRNESEKATLAARRAWCYLVLVFFSFLCLFFFYILVINSTRTHFEIQKGFSLLPGKSLVTNFKNVLADANIPVLTGIRNSLIVSACSAALSVYFSALTAYGIYAYNFKFKKAAFAIILLIMTMPTQVSALGFLQLITKMGLKNSFIPLIVPSFAARQMAETAMDAFLLPRCNKRFPQEIGRGRPCLNAHIGKCMAVCSGKISCENYNQAVRSAVHLIRYGKKDILKTLNERMMEASDRLEFETAALIRDQINAITKVTAGQKVVVDPDVEMDVVALAGTPGSVCAAVLRFREGRLTDKREFLFHDTADIAAAREEFLPRYYLDDEQIPKVIAVDELPPDADALQQALNEKRGSEVQLYVPQRGDKARLVEMAHTNAVERLARESGRYAREEKLLDELAQVLGLAKPPRAIESYDISNWGDGTSVCGMVTFKDGKPYKAGYRKFKMKTVLGTDDYASLAETVSRRAAEYEKYAALAKAGEPSNNYFGQKPDLLLMDGGRGQVSAAREALAGTALADVPLYGMVKDDHHRTRAIVDSEGREIAINMNRGTFTFITAIQDETHRFANAYRKQQMHQKSYASTLTEVPGVGPKTAKALMARFKSVSAVREAAMDQLENTPGVGPRLARTIYDHFHPQN